MSILLSTLNTQQSNSNSFTSATSHIAVTHVNSTLVL